MTKKMAKKSTARKRTGSVRRTTISQRGGRNVAAGGDMTISGDLVFGSKSTTTTTTINIGQLDKSFGDISRRIDALPMAPDAKSELKQNVEKIKQEVKKGEQADPAKVERWLKFIGTMSGDIAQVVAASLANPAAGVGTAIRLIAQKAQQSR